MISNYKEWVGYSIFYFGIVAYLGLLDDSIWDLVLGYLAAMLFLPKSLRSPMGGRRVMF